MNVGLIGVGTMGSRICEALERAARHVGRNPRVLVTPEAFRSVGVHLHTRG